MADGRDLYQILFHNQKQMIGFCDLLVENLGSTFEMDGRNCSIPGSFLNARPNSRMFLFELRKSIRCDPTQL